MLTFLRPRRTRRPSVLNERGQGFAALLFALAALLWIAAAAKGVV